MKAVRNRTCWLNSVVPGSKRLWSPSTDCRLSIRHFVDEKPTNENPYPRLHFCCPDDDSHAKRILFGDNARPVERQKTSEGTVPMKYKILTVQFSCNFGCGLQINLVLPYFILFFYIQCNMTKTLNSKPLLKPCDCH